MSPDRPVKVVGRCTVCGDLIVEVADMKPTGTGLGMKATVIRRCGCGDFEPREGED